jgi:hypothetical protein
MTDFRMPAALALIAFLGLFLGAPGTGLPGGTADAVQAAPVPATPQELLDYAARARACPGLEDFSGGCADLALAIVLAAAIVAIVFLIVHH